MKLTALQNAAIQLSLMPNWLYTSIPDNRSFHNLCTFLTIPKRTKSLIGLGLNFCPTPTNTTAAFDSARFRRDIYTKYFFSGSQSTFVPKLYIRTNWQPNDNEIHSQIISRTNNFLHAINAIFLNKKCSTNLIPSQELLLKYLKNNELYYIMKCDKNMGPAIIERAAYIKIALQEHLSDKKTYLFLQPEQQQVYIDTAKQRINEFCDKYFPRKYSNDRKFLLRSMESVSDPFSYFYLLAKVHKSPWKTRPIISCSGSITEGLGRWLDYQLQKIVSQLPYVIKSSFELKTTLCNLHIPKEAKFFSMDAKSMYTNIDTEHALCEIGHFLRTTHYAKNVGINIEATLTALQIVMQFNIFKFGDTAWLQQCGTAMGTPPAPCYATLYYAIHEINFIKRFPEILYYGRYIDDGIGIWVPKSTKDLDLIKWFNFQEAANMFGDLEWEFTPRSQQINFLDIDLKFTNNHISTKISEKAFSLFLYLPPHSAHAPGVLKGLIYGGVLRIYRLTTEKSEILKSTQQFYQRLRARGYSSYILQPIFNIAYTNALKQTSPNLNNTIKNQTTNKIEKSILFHVPFHPKDPPSRLIQQLFKTNMIQPPGAISLPFISNRNNSYFDISKLTIAYSRQLNIGNIVSPRKLNDIGAPVSSFLQTNYILANNHSA